MCLFTSRRDFPARIDDVAAADGVLPDISRRDVRYPTARRVHVQ